MSIDKKRLSCYITYSTITKKGRTMKQQNILNRINTYSEYKKKITDYETHINMMIGKKGKPMPLHVMIVSGDKGVGKTYKANQILSEQTIRPYIIVTASLSAVQLYKLMWEHSDAIIVLDDVNSILQDPKDGASLLKACTDSYHVRQLHWQKQNPNCVSVHKFNLPDNISIARKMDEMAANNKKMAMLHAENRTFPDTFFFTGSVIILTNKPLSVIDRVTEGALSNRGWHQEMLFSVEGAVELLKNTASSMRSFNDIPLKVKNVKKALQFLTTKEHIQFYKQNGRLPTIRTLGKIALECECGNELDEDTLYNNTEAPAY